MFFAVPRVFGPKRHRRRLRLGSMVLVNIGCVIELNEQVDVGDRVSIGPDVMILTSSHQIGTRDQRCGPTFTAPVVIEAGAWIGARSVLLPGVTVGAGAVVAANSVVSKDVAPNTLVAGVPAQVVVKRLPG